MTEFTQPDNTPITGPPIPEAGKPQERLMNSEELLFAMTQAGDYITEGSREIRKFGEALESGDIAKIKQRTEEAMAYYEGWFKSPYAERYDLNKPNSLLDVKEKFTSQGNSADRRDGTILVRHLRDRLTNKIKEIDDYLYERDDWEETTRTQLLKARENEIWSKRNGLSEADIRRGAVILVDGIPGDETHKGDLQIKREQMERLAEHREVLDGLSLHIAARQEFDDFFCLRQQYAHDANSLITVIQNPRTKDGQPIIIDTADWIALHQGNTEVERDEFGNIVRVDGEPKLKVSEFGMRVGEVKRQIIKKGQNNRSLYVDGILDDAAFKEWIEDLLPHTVIDGKQRMDVLWIAWKEAVLTEEITELAWTVDDKGKYRFSPNPCLMSDFGKQIHMAKAMADEFGMDALLSENEVVDLDTMQVLDRGDNLRVLRDMTAADRENYFERQTRRQSEKPTVHKLSHSGHPILLMGGWGRINEGFAHRTKVEKWTVPAGVVVLAKHRDPHNPGTIKEISIYDIFMDYGINMADPRFPLANISRMSSTPGDEKVPPGSLSGWGLELRRGLAVKNDYVLKLPQPQELNRGWCEGIRNIEKRKRIQPDSGFRPGKVGPKERDGGVVPKNPMAILAAGYLYYIGQHDEVYKDDIRGFKYHGAATSPSKLVSALPNKHSAGPSDGDFIANLYGFNIVNRGEASWLVVNFTRLKLNEFWKQVDDPSLSVN